MSNTKEAIDPVQLKDDGPQKEEEEGQIEQEARAQGWVPEDSFRGNPSDWVDAATFAQRGRDINPILRNNNKRLLSQIDEVRKQNDELRATMQEFSKHHADTAQREYDRALNDLKVAKKAAIDAGDTADALTIADQIEELKEAKPKITVPIVKPVVPQQDPELAVWVGENDWFGKDKVRTQLALAAGTELHEEQPDLRGREFLNELESRLEQEFPSRFGNKNRKAPPLTAGRGTPINRSTSSNQGHSVSDLPADAREAMKKFIKQGLLTEKQYLQDYFGENNE